MATALNQLVSPEPRLAGGMMGPTEPTRSERELSNIEKIRGQLGLKREEQAVYKGEEAQFGAEQKAARAKELAKATGAERAAIEAAPAYTEAQQVERDVMEARFEPTQRSAQENMALMTAMNILGYFIGAGGKNRAQQAMAAFNGMLEGKNAGDVERFKQEKVKFDTNLKALKDRYSVLTSQLKRVADLAARDKDRAMQELDVVLAQNEADFIRQHINKQGLAATIKSLEDAEKGAVRVYEQAAREEDRARSAAQREAERRDFQRQERLGREAFQAEMQRERAEQRAEQATTRQTQEQSRMQRAVNSLGGVASALESIVELPAGTTTGWLPNLKTKDGMVNAIRNQLGRKIATADAELMNTFLTGIGRNLASIEASGLATGLVTLAEQLQSGTYINAGIDDPYKVAAKLADIKRIAVENIMPSIEAGTMTKAQIASAEKLINRIDKAIPYTTIDVARALRDAKGKSRTVGEAAAGVAEPLRDFATAEEAEAAKLPAGTRIRIGGRLAVVE